MFELALSLPLLVSPLAAPLPQYNLSQTTFHPESFQVETSFYNEAKVTEFLKSVTFDYPPFGPADAHFVNPVFSVEGAK